MVLGADLGAPWKKPGLARPGSRPGMSRDHRAAADYPVQP
jgi:hypothetical protein